MATTQCPGCSEMLDHRPDWSVHVERRLDDDAATTVVRANGFIVVHKCSRAADNAREPVAALSGSTAAAGQPRPIG